MRSCFAVTATIVYNRRTNGSMYRDKHSPRVHHLYYVSSSETRDKQYYTRFRMTCNHSTIIRLCGVQIVVFMRSDVVFFFTAHNFVCYVLMFVPFCGHLTRCSSLCLNELSPTIRISNRQPAQPAQQSFFQPLPDV